jgi:hypothetical protein
VLVLGLLYRGEIPKGVRHSLDCAVGRAPARYEARGHRRDRAAATSQPAPDRNLTGGGIGYRRAGEKSESVLFRSCAEIGQATPDRVA